MKTLPFYPAVLIKSSHETPVAKNLLFRLEDPTIAATYQVPGQYAVIRPTGHKNGYFAFTHAPGAFEWDFLVKDSSPLTHHLVGMKEGERVEMSKAQGKGFAMEKALGKNVYLFAVGTGMAPLRAVIFSILAKRDQFGKVELFFGARNPEDFAFRSEFIGWIQKGIAIHQTLSNRDVVTWPSHFGYVQNLIGKTVTAENSVACVSGMKGMIDGVTQKLMERGFAKDAILTNY